MQKTYSSLQDWFTSNAYMDSAECKVLLMTMIQAVEDANLRIADNPQIPDTPNPDFYQTKEEYDQAMEKHGRRIRNTRARKKMLQELRRERETARYWLMLPGSSFEKAAGQLNIDFEVIRNALLETTHWAGRYTCLNSLSK